MRCSGTTLTVKCIETVKALVETTFINTDKRGSGMIKNIVNFSSTKNQRGQCNILAAFYKEKLSGN
jgi:hypothetical protein